MTNFDIYNIYLTPDLFLSLFPPIGYSYNTPYDPDPN